MNETKSENPQPLAGAGISSNNAAIALIFGAVLITLILTGCFLTALIMLLDFIPVHAIFAH